jgi:hypothetical protein
MESVSALFGQCAKGLYAAKRSFHYDNANIEYFDDFSEIVRKCQDGKT